MLGCAVLCPTGGILGCANTVHYRVDNAAVPAEAIETFRLEKAEIPAKVQVVDFSVDTVNAPYADEDKKLFRQDNAIYVANRIHESLGKRAVFKEVSRSTLSQPQLSDYIVSGSYDFTDVRENYPFNYSIAITDVIHLKVIRTKDGQQILSKDYPEQVSDTTRSSRTPPHVKYLQVAFIEKITAEVKLAIAADFKNQTAEGGIK